LQEVFAHSQPYCIRDNFPIVSICVKVQHQLAHLKGVSMRIVLLILLGIITASVITVAVIMIGMLFDRPIWQIIFLSMGIVATFTLTMEGLHRTYLSIRYSRLPGTEISLD